MDAGEVVVWSQCGRTLDRSHLLLCLASVGETQAWRKATWHRCGEAGQFSVRCVYIIADSDGGLGGVGLLVAHRWWW